LKCQSVAPWFNCRFLSFDKSASGVNKRLRETLRNALFRETELRTSSPRLLRDCYYLFGGLRCIFVSLSLLGPAERSHPSRGRVSESLGRTAGGSGCHSPVFRTGRGLGR
jgi:hypothetical protein